MRVTTKGQVTIPKEIREHLGIVPGSEVEFVREPGGVKLIPIDGDLTAGERLRRFEQALKGMAGSLDLQGMTTDEYIDFVRGPREDLDLD
jgi:AbrB family looped-hinge helix DNA binding protein